MDFSSAFNTIIPTLLQTKLTQLSIPSSICQWITSFLTDRQQLVRLGKFMSNSRSTNTGVPQGCVLSPLLFSLYTNDFTSKDPSFMLLKFADDTTLIGLIQDGDESAYRQEVKELAVWCSGEIQVPGIHHLSGPELGHSLQLHCKKKSPTKVVLPSPAE